jgi:hypothetical protein
MNSHLNTDWISNMNLGKIRDENILTIVIPTAGRETIWRCLDSLKPKNQGGWGIDIVVVVDTLDISEESMMNIIKAVNDNNVQMETRNADIHDWGYPQMEYIYHHREDNGLYIMNIGDDDVMVNGIIPKMVDILANSPLRPYMFQAELHPSPQRAIPHPITLWNDSCRSIIRSRVTGQNLVVPNIPQFMGHMTDDYEFIRQTAEKWDYNVGWIPLITCKCY